MSRLWARCVISNRSPIPPKISVWSPTTSPARTAKTPISLRARSPTIPRRPYTPESSIVRPRAVATASARRTAVPEGASFLNRWCVSTISTSYSSPSTRATSAATLNMRFTPTLMLGDWTIATFAAAFRIRSMWAGPSPVLPMTIGFPAAAAVPALLAEESGPVKSIATSAAATAFAKSSVTGTPALPAPAASKASCREKGVSRRLDRPGEG